MQEALGTIIGLVFLVVFVMGGTGLIEEEYVYPQELVRSESLCKNNGGVYRLEYDSSSFDVYCLDGAQFKNQPLYKEEQ